MRFPLGGVLFGALFGFAGLFVMSLGHREISVVQGLLADGVETNGLIIDVTAKTTRRDDRTETDYYPDIRFQDASGLSHVFRGSSSSSSSKYKVGDEISVTYLPSDPQVAKANFRKNPWGGVIFSLLFGGIFFLVVSGIALATIRRWRVQKWLLKNGESVIAKFDRVREVKVRHKNSTSTHYLVLATWTDPKTKKEYKFKSDPFRRFDPGSYIETGQSIKVLIDPNNPKTNYVDLSFLDKFS